MNNVIELPKLGIKGTVVSWEVINQDGSIDRACYTPSDNMILDYGLDLFGADQYSNYANFLTYFAIGTGTDLPVVTDTLLGHESNRQTAVYSAWNVDSCSIAGSDPYYVSYQRGVQTSLGSLNGTYTEIGFSGSASLTAPLFCKFRLVDEDLVPTSIAISSIQQLRLKYVLTIQVLPAVPTSYSTTITGIGAFNYTAGWQEVNSIWDVTQLLTSRNNTQYNWVAIRENAYTFQPIGASATFETGNYKRNFTTWDTYVSGSYQMYLNASFAVTEAVWVNKAIYIGYTGRVTWVAAFDPASYIDKPNTHILTLKFKFSWARA